MTHRVIATIQGIRQPNLLFESYSLALAWCYQHGMSIILDSSAEETWLTTDNPRLMPSQAMISPIGEEDKE